MMALFVAVVMTASATCAGKTMEGQTLFSFEGDDHSGWSTVHDTVMGGRSEGGFDVSNGILRFQGNLSLENNGGFTSIRHPIQLDLRDRDVIRLRVRGDGRPYQLRLQTDARYRGRPVAFAAGFETEPGKWITVDVPFTDLRATFRGRALPAYRFDAGAIELVGLLLADKSPGPFLLEIDTIQAC